MAKCRQEDVDLTEGRGFPRIHRVLLFDQLHAIRKPERHETAQEHQIVHAKGSRTAVWRTKKDVIAGEALNGFWGKQVGHGLCPFLSEAILRRLSEGGRNQQEQRGIARSPASHVLSPYLGWTWRAV